MQRMAHELHTTCFMHTSVQITFRGMPRSEALEAIIRQRVEWLEAFHDRISRCHAVVDVPHRHQHNGRAYSIRLDLTTPTGEIVASSHEGDTVSDVHSVIRDVFDAARRQLEDELRRRRPNGAL
jgi:ribosome-associated translation inhibitor RaiA